MNKTNAEKILKYCENLSKIKIDSFKNYRIINPYKDNKEQIKLITTKFYNKYYNDGKKRRLILGSNPARRATAITGIPFEDAVHLQQETGIFISNYYINKSSSNFLYDVIKEYGGCNNFYNEFYMNFIFPLGIAKINSDGSEKNCNYYEIKGFEKKLYKYIVESIKEIVKFNIDTSVCYCIGSGKNYEFLLKINKEYNFFQKIIALEHPRFIMQYNSKNKELYLKKYLNALMIK
ncbi:MAG: SMUG2 DNA glycosylase family protein [Bacilli bacterium]|nr:SMUG2 DNA glycosylase family protein [Bacilli bacterium]